MTLILAVIERGADNLYVSNDPEKGEKKMRCCCAVRQQQPRQLSPAAEAGIRKKERRRREVPPAGGRPFVRLLNESASYNKLILLAARPDLEGAKEERE
jgi:hypothetical protein